MYGQYNFGNNQNSSISLLSSDYGIYVNDEGINDLPSSLVETQDIPGSNRSVIVSKNYYEQQDLTLHCCIKHDAEKNYNRFKQIITAMQSAAFSYGFSTSLWHGYQGVILLWDDYLKPREYFNYFTITEGITTENWSRNKEQVSFDLKLKTDARKYYVNYSSSYTMLLRAGKGTMDASSIVTTNSNLYRQELCEDGATLVFPEDVDILYSKPQLTIKGYGTFSIVKKYANSSYKTKLFSFKIAENSYSSVSIDCETLYTSYPSIVSLANGTTPEDLGILFENNVEYPYEISAEYDSTITSIVVQPKWYKF